MSVLYDEYLALKSDVDAKKEEVDTLLGVLSDMKVLYSLYSQNVKTVNLIETKDVDGNIISSNQIIFDLWNNRTNKTNQFITLIGLSTDEYLELLSSGSKNAVLNYATNLLHEKIETLNNLSDQMNAKKDEITQSLYDQNNFVF